MTTTTTHFGFHKQTASDLGENLYLDLATDMDTLDGILYSKINVVEPFEDMLPASTTGVHSAKGGTGSLQTITTSITSPDVPRNITVTSAGDKGNGATTTISGYNAFGESTTENITIVNPGTAYGLKAFSIVTSYTVPAVYLDSGDTLACGWSDKIGFSNPIELTSDVYKIKIDQDNVAVNLGKVSVTYATYDFATIWDWEDIQVWYKAIIGSGAL